MLDRITCCLPFREAVFQSLCFKAFFPQQFHSIVGVEAVGPTAISNYGLITIEHFNSFGDLVWGDIDGIGQMSCGKFPFGPDIQNRHLPVLSSFQ